MRFLVSVVLLACMVSAPAHAAVQFAEIEKTPWGSSPQDVATALGAADPAKLAREDTITRPLTISRGDAEYKTPVVYKFARSALGAVTAIVQRPDGKPLSKDEAALIYADMVRGVGEGKGAPLESNTPCPREEQACKRTLWRNGRAGTVAVAIFDGTGAVPPSIFVQYRPMIYTSRLNGRDVVFAQEAQALFIAKMNGVAPLGELALMPAENPANKDAIYATYTLKQAPLSLDKAKAEAREATVCIIRGMMGQDLNPAKSKMTISTRLQMREQGITGSDNVRSFGRWRYDYSNDSLEWLAPGK